ncbi:MAG: type II toxin-antitoxin system PemK/MazF family toxin [Gemmataceae bacterium]|nr:type II toxin-antitoxin system PemK/MazF family toxin [Gemmataceae bacterium]
MNRGEVVLVDWPFSDRTGSKLRPAVVVQADLLNGLIDDTVLIAVTTKSRFAVTEVLLDPVVETYSGLTRRSYAVCNQISTLDQSLIHHLLGVLSGHAMVEIAVKIKKALELP